MTIDEQQFAPGDDVRPPYVAGIIAARMGRSPTGRRPLRALDVLDLACRTGAFSVHLAELGAEVLGIEGRASNLAMAPEHERVTYMEGDVREVAIESVSSPFDVTLCLGLLYHLEPDDAVGLLARMRVATRERGIAIIDTHVAPSSFGSVEVRGRSYQGHWWTEPDNAETGWSSLGNKRSWWFTLESLVRACIHAGWFRVEQIDSAPGDVPGRVWLVLS